METLNIKVRINRKAFSLDVGLNLPGKGVTAIFGQSGSGKTTLLRYIAGLERSPDGFLDFKGEIWHDKNIWLPAYKRPLGYVFQEASLFEHLDVLGNLRYGMKRAGLKQNSKFDFVVELLGLGNLLKRKPALLSGGERQRVGIARALAVNPEILLMDEPLSSLDLKRKKEILPYLERLHEELKIPVIYVSHSPDEVARLADYIVYLEDGKVIARGQLKEMFSCPDLPISLGEDPGVVFDAVVAEIDQKWNLSRLEFNGGSLWAIDRGTPVGRRVRTRVLAKDVSLALSQPVDTSIQNIFQGSVSDISDDQHPGLVLVRICIGNSTIIARLTRRSASELKIEIGKTVWAQVKLAALLD
jgi:molybdate transport system ATP-binding protein